MQMRLIFLTLTSLFITSCALYDGFGYKDYKHVEFEELVKNIDFYDEHKISLMGILNLNHFETIGLNNLTKNKRISIDWRCIDTIQIGSDEEELYRASLDKINQWLGAGYNDKYVNIKGTFVKNYETGFSKNSGIVNISEITIYSGMEAVRSQIIGKINMNCSNYRFD